MSPPAAPGGGPPVPGGSAPHVLDTAEAGGRVIRGSALRGLGYGAGLLLGVAVSVLLLRHLGVVDFGRYVTVTAVLGIVSGVTDAGLTAVGTRELSTRRGSADADRVLANLLALRLVATVAGVLLAVGFTVVAGYDTTLVLGTALGGIGVLLVNLQATAMLPLSVDLRIGRLTAVEVLRHVITLAGVAVLVAMGAALLPFFAVQILVGAGVLAVTPLVIGRGARLAPAVDRRIWGHLVREALPVAVAVAMNVIYFRVLVIQTSLIASDVETGLFATSFRIIEVLLTLPVVLLSVALPVLSVAGAEDRGRLRASLDGLTRAAVVAAVPVALAIAVPAAPLLRLLGGEEYVDAAGVLRVQALALVALFVGQAWQLVLIATRRQRGVAIANGVALVAVVAAGAVLIPAAGALGAAWAAVIGEGVLALSLLAFIAAAGRDLVPGFGFLGRVALAAGAAVAVALIPGVPGFGLAAASVAVYAVVALAVRAAPPEVLDALRTGLPRWRR